MNTRIFPFGDDVSIMVPYVHVRDTEIRINEDAFRDNKNALLAVNIFVGNISLKSLLASKKDKIFSFLANGKNFLPLLVNPRNHKIVKELIRKARPNERFNHYHPLYKYIDLVRLAELTCESFESMLNCAIHNMIQSIPFMEKFADDVILVDGKNFIQCREWRLHSELLDRLVGEESEYKKFVRLLSTNAKYSSTFPLFTRQIQLPYDVERQKPQLPIPGYKFFYKFFSNSLIKISASIFKTDTNSVVCYGIDDVINNDALANRDIFTRTIFGTYVVNSQTVSENRIYYDPPKLDYSSWSIGFDEGDDFLLLLQYNYITSILKKNVSVVSDDNFMWYIGPVQKINLHTYTQFNLQAIQNFDLFEEVVEYYQSPHDIDEERTYLREYDKTYLVQND